MFYRIAVLCLVSVLGCATTFAETAEAILLQKIPVEYMGGVPGLDKSGVKGKLTITTKNIRFEAGKRSFDIDPSKVTYLSGGEYAKRRVKGAIIGAVLLSPIALFALIGKKKRTITVIEFTDQEITEGVDPSERTMVGAAVLKY